MAFSRKKYSGPMKNRGIVNGKADVSKEELDDFRAKYGADKTLRDLLNADRASKKPDVSKAKAGPAEYETKKAPPMDNSPKNPEVMKPLSKADDTSLSVSERIKNARERARTSDTGTDTRSVSDRLKSAFGMKKGGMVKKASAKKGSVARGGGAATRGTKFQGVL